MDFEVILLEYLSVIKYKWREKLKYLHLYFLNLTEGEGAVALTIEVGTVAFPKVMLSSSGLMVSAITS